MLSVNHGWVNISWIWGLWWGLGVKFHRGRAGGVRLVRVFRSLFAPIFKARKIVLDYTLFIVCIVRDLFHDDSGSRLMTDSG